MLCAASAFAAEPSHLRVTTTAGEPVLFSFDDSPEVSFAGTRLHVATASQALPTAFEMEDIESIDFAAVSSAEAAADLSGIHVRYADDALTFTGLPEGCTAEVYDLSGRCLIRATPGNDTWTLSRAALTRGTYIIRVATLTIKAIL